MKPKPKPLQYANRARRIARRMIECVKRIKTLEESIEGEKTSYDRHRIGKEQQRLHDLQRRQNELEKLGYSSAALFLLSLLG